MYRLVLAMALIGGAACSKSSDAHATKTGSGGSAGSAGSGGSAGSATAAVPVAAGTVAVFVGDKQVATVDAAKLATWPRVDGLVPAEDGQLGTWTGLSIKGKAPADIASPSAKWPNYVPVLYPGADGPTLGWFDLVDLHNRGAAKMTYAGVTEVRITRDTDSDRGQNEEGGTKDFDPKMIDIAIEGGTKKLLTGEEILKMPREAPPNGDTETQGWKLTTFLAAAGIKNPPKLLLSESGGAQVTITAKELDPAVSVPYFKLNKKGQLRLRIYTKLGDGWQLGGNLRGLSSIKVVK